jgi:glycosyltransferase involved in cell wall biosynthesis
VRIVFLASVYLPNVGGIEVMLHDLIDELRRRGHESLILCSSASAAERGVADFDGVRVARLGVNDGVSGRNPRVLLEAQRAISDEVLAFEPDVVHTHDVGPMLWLYRQATRGNRRPLIVTMHTIISGFIGGKSPALAAELRRADLVTAVSQSVADDVVATEPSVVPKLSVIPNGIPRPREPVTPVPTDPARLVFVGRLIEQKRVDVLIQAFAILTHQYPALRLTIAGSGPLDAKLRQLAVDRGVADHIDFLGLVDHDRVQSIVRDATAVVMPSDFEGLPLVALETAWMGRPIVGSRSPGMVDAVVDGETGWLVKGADVAALAAGIGDLLADPARIQALGTAARARAELEFSLEMCASRYEALYERAIAQDEVSERV